MKKGLIILLIILTLCSCKPKETLSLMVPQGSPAMTVLGLNSENYLIDVVNGPDPLLAAFGSLSHDAIIAPTNLGAKLFQSKDDYQLAAVLVWGNYHIVSTSFQNPSLQGLEGKEIMVFGRNQTSDIIIKHLLDAYNIDANLIYVDSVQLAAAEYLVDPTKIVMVAEPSLSKIKALVPGTKSLDLQEVYSNLHDGSSYPQASLFVKKDLNKTKVSQLIDDLTSSIHWVNEKSDLVCQKGVEFGILDDEIIFKDAIEGSHLMLQIPTEAKTSLTNYLMIILDMNPNLIGGQIPNEGFYWSD